MLASQGCIFFAYLDSILRIITLTGQRKRINFVKFKKKKNADEEKVELKGDAPEISSAVMLRSLICPKGSVQNFHLEASQQERFATSSDMTPSFPEGTLPLPQPPGDLPWGRDLP